MLVELDDISRGYEGQDVLAGLSWSLEAGQRAAVVGPSGSGKSTLLNILGLLDLPDAGTYRLDGREAGSLSERERAGLRATSIGFVFQLHHLLPHLTALENTMIPAHALPGKPDWAEVEERAVALLEQVGLGEHLGKLPGQLSGGERQRVAVVRSLINRPRLLLADEPTGALDEKNAGSLTDLLCRVSEEENICMVMVTHDRDMAARVGDIWELGGGVIRKHGPAS